MNHYSLPATVKAPKWQFLDATTLKYMAAFLMLLDHIHQMFVAQGAPLWLTMLGRPVFPMFLFAAAESFHYTRSKRKYMTRLLIASVSMAAMTMVLSRLLPNPNIVLMNNAFSTFFVASVYMLAWDCFSEGLRTKHWKPIGKALGLAVLPIVTVAPLFLVAVYSADPEVSGTTIRLLASLALMIPSILSTEGGFVMVLLGLAFYIFRIYRWMQIGVLLLLSAALYYRNPSDIQWMMGFAAIPMALYNGQKGRGAKNFFYMFYPAHISLLYILACLLP